jgi:UDP:flavonoid glycosyltransferase YjiC (YdhE family)
MEKELMILGAESLTKNGAGNDVDKEEIRALEFVEPLMSSRGEETTRVLCAANAGVGHTIPALELATRLEVGKKKISIFSRTDTTARIANLYGAAAKAIEVSEQGIRNPDLELRALTEAAPQIMVVDYDPLTWTLLKVLKPPCNISILRAELLLHYVRCNAFLPDKFGFEDGSATRRSNMLLEQHGVSPVDDVRRLYAGDIVVIPSIPELDPISDLTRAEYPNTTFIYSGPLCMRSQPPLPQTFLDWCGTQRRADRPVILITLGTVWGHRIVGDLVDGLLRPDLAVVATAPNAQIAAILSAKRNDRLFVIGFADVYAIAQKVDLVVHHCGHATMQLVLLAEKPSITLPSGEYDREDNAWRLETLGCSRHLGHDFFRRSLGSSAVAHEALKLLRRPGWRQAVERTARAMRGHGGTEFSTAFKEAMAPHLGRSATQSVNGFGSDFLRGAARICTSERDANKRQNA